MSSMAVAPAVHNDQQLHVKEPSLIGGWEPIKDPDSPHVRDIGEWAVKEYDRESGASLMFMRVVSGATQVVAGVNYRLVLLTIDGSNKMKTYEAVVWEKVWEQFRKLLSFKPLLEN